MPKKRVWKDKTNVEVCILHSYLKRTGKFIVLKNVVGHQEKLSYLHALRDKILCSPDNYPKHLKTSCNTIPESLDDDKGNIGYHKLCYRRFTYYGAKNSSDTKENKLGRQRSQQKRSATLESTYFSPLNAYFVIK